MRGAVLGGIIALLPALGIADDVQSVRFVTRDGVASVDVTGAGTTAHTPFNLASVGKTMTSVAVLRLVADGRLSLDSSPASFVDRTINNGFGGLEDVTLSHLLTMTSGLPDYYFADYQLAALGNPDRYQKPNAALAFAYDDDRLFEPGTDFHYSNTNYVLLGLVLEGVTGLSYAEAMQRGVFDVVGMRETFVFGSQDLPDAFPLGHEGHVHVREYYEADGFGDGGVISTAPDLARFYQALLFDRTLLPQTQLDAMLQDPSGAGYGMGIVVDDPVFGHNGADLGFVSEVLVDVATSTIAILMSASSDADTSWVAKMIDAD